MFKTKATPIRKLVSEEVDVTNQDSFSSLADELTLLVLSLGEFEAVELSKIALVCRKFNRISSDYSLWKSALCDDFILSPEALDLLKNKAGGFKQAYVALQQAYKKRLMDHFHLSEESAKRRKNEFGDYRKAYQACMNTSLEQSMMQDLISRLEEMGHAVPPLFFQGHPWFCKEPDDYLESLQYLLKDENMSLQAAFECMDGLTPSQALLLNKGLTREIVVGLDEDMGDLLAEFHQDGVTPAYLKGFDEKANYSPWEINDAKKKFSISTTEAFEVLRDLNVTQRELYIEYSQEFALSKEYIQGITELNCRIQSMMISQLITVLSLDFEQAIEFVRALKPLTLSYIHDNLEQPAIAGKLQELSCGAVTLCTTIEYFQTVIDMQRRIHDVIKEGIKYSTNKLKMETLTRLRDHCLEINYYPGSHARSFLIGIFKKYQGRGFEGAIDSVVGLNTYQLKILRKLFLRKIDGPWSSSEFTQNLEYLRKLAAVLQAKAGHIESDKAADLIIESFKLPDMSSLEEALELSQALTNAQLKFYIKCHTLSQYFDEVRPASIPVQLQEVQLLNQLSELHSQALDALAGYYSEDTPAVEFINEIASLTETELKMVTSAQAPMESIRTLNKWQKKAVLELDIPLKYVSEHAPFDKQTYRSLLFTKSEPDFRNDWIPEVLNISQFCLGKFLQYYFMESAFKNPGIEGGVRANFCPDVFNAGADWLNSELHLLAYLDLVVAEVNQGMPLHNAVETQLAVLRAFSMEEIAERALSHLQTNAEFGAGVVLEQTRVAITPVSF